MRGTVPYHKEQLLKGSMRENGFRALGGLAQRLTSGLAEKRNKGRGASIARLRPEWSVIVGADIARLTQPEALLPGRGGRSGKALRLKVAAAAAGTRPPGDAADRRQCSRREGSRAARGAGAAGRAHRDQPARSDVRGAGRLADAA